MKLNNCARHWNYDNLKILNPRRLRVSMALSKHKVLKSTTILHREKIDEPVPDELQEKREELGFDFGKFDYVMVDGKAVLLDTNRTPTLNALSKQSAMPGLLELASGIDSFLK